MSVVWAESAIDCLNDDDDDVKKERTDENNKKTVSLITMITTDE